MGSLELSGGCRVNVQKRGVVSWEFWRGWAQIKGCRDTGRGWIRRRFLREPRIVDEGMNPRSQVRDGSGRVWSFTERGEGRDTP